MPRSCWSESCGLGCQTSSQIFGRRSMEHATTLTSRITTNNPNHHDANTSYISKNVNSCSFHGVVAHCATCSS